MLRSSFIEEVNVAILWDHSKNGKCKKYLMKFSHALPLLRLLENFQSLTTFVRRLLKDKYCLFESNGKHWWCTMCAAARSTCSLTFRKRLLSVTYSFCIMCFYRGWEQTLKHWRHLHLNTITPRSHKFINFRSAFRLADIFYICICIKRTIVRKPSILLPLVTSVVPHIYFPLCFTSCHENRNLIIAVHLKSP